MMKFLLRCIPLILATSALADLPALPTRAHAKGELRVMTYNILGGRNTDGKRDLTRVANVIRAVNPDLVALQEVDVKTTRIKGVDVPAELARLTGLHAAFGEAMPFAGGSYGVGVLSRWPIEKQSNIPLPHGPKDEPRTALQIQCTSPVSSKPIVFVATHLEAFVASTRADQVAHLLKQLTPASLPGPAIFAGDLNATAESTELLQLFTNWQPAWPKDQPGFTFPSDKPNTRIDHILLQPNAGWKVDKTFRGDAAIPDNPAWSELLGLTSDHLPVVLEVTLSAK